jgi:L-rhamnose mutarotase
MNEYVFFLDLIDNEELITQYDQWHKEVWPEVELQILNSGLTSCRIYRVSNRLVLIAHSDQEMDWKKKSDSDLAHGPTVEWENLMWKFQRAIPGSASGEKWRKAELIYKLESK